MSCRAVSWEHLAMRAHLAAVKFPSKSSSKRPRTLTQRSLTGMSAMLFQNRALTRVAVTDASAPWVACSKQPRNQEIQVVTSVPSLWVCSRTR